MPIIKLPQNGLSYIWNHRDQCPKQRNCGMLVWDDLTTSFLKVSLPISIHLNESGRWDQMCCSDRLYSCFGFRNYWVNRLLNLNTLRSIFFASAKIPIMLSSGGTFYWPHHSAVLIFFSKCYIFNRFHKLNYVLQWFELWFELQD